MQLELAVLQLAGWSSIVVWLDDRQRSTAGRGDGDESERDEND
jgi:hypothetical protein